MKIKKVISVTSVILGISILAGSVYAFTVQNPWAGFTKKAGVVKNIDGVLVNVPGDKEKDEVANSVDPKSGQPTKKFNTQAMEKDKTKKNITLIVDNKGKNQNLTFSYIEKGNKKVYFTEPGEGIYMIPIPNSNDYIVQFEEDLYLLKGKEVSIAKLLKDKVGKYDINDLYLESIEEMVPVWGSDPVVRPDGKMVAYYSSRNAIIEGEEFRNGQLWVKNIETGEEKPVYNEAFEILGWGSSSIYIKHSDSVVEVNIDTGEAKNIVDFVLHATVSYPHLLMQMEYGKASVMNLETNSVTDVIEPSLNRIGNVVKKDGSPWVMIFNYPNREDPKRTLIVLDLSTQKIKTINEPDDYTFTDAQWTEEGQMLINVRKLGASVEETYIVDLQDVK